MPELSLEDIEFIKILATSDATILQAGMNEATKTRLDEQIGIMCNSLLVEYGYDHDSLHVPKGEIVKLYFHESTDIPSNDESGNLMVDGKYDATVRLNGYSDQGETFLRSVYIGVIDVVTP